VKLLLDTYAFIWLDGEPAQLSAKARASCADSANELYLSLASIWELQIKLQLGKLTLRGDLPINQQPACSVGKHRLV
jgi:PIN domain nuclease of toxin-antitoxin system